MRNILAPLLAAVSLGGASAAEMQHDPNIDPRFAPYTPPPRGHKGKPLKNKKTRSQRSLKKAKRRMVNASRRANRK